MLFDGIETAKAAVAPGEFQCSAQGEDAGLAAWGREAAGRKLCHYRDHGGHGDARWRRS